MKIQQREINLLIIVGVILVVFCSYFFGFKNLMAKNDQVSAEVAKLEDKYNNLKTLKSKVEGYKKDTADYNAAIEEMYDSFDSGVSQEYTLKFLETIENNAMSVWVKNATLSQPEQIFTFGDIRSSNPTMLGQKVYDSSNVGYAVKSTVNFEASYDDFKETMDFLLNNQSKCTVESISVSYNGEEDVVSGSFVLTQYAIVGPDREFDGAHVTNKYYGTDNIFQSPIFDPEIDGEENGNDILSDYDLYLSLQSYESDAPALKLGFKTDASKTIVDEDNKVKDVTIKITGTEGNYRVSYKVGTTQYPEKNFAEGAEFVPGVKLSLLVNSSGRTSVNDLSGANVAIVNESDMTLHIKLINEDEDSPRFKIVDKQGDIVIYQ